MIRIVPIKLISGKAEEFSAEDLTLEAGESVIVDTEKGMALGKVLSPPHEKERRLLLKTPRKVIRKAAPEDLEKLEKNKQLEKDAFQFCLQKVKEKGLNMKLVKTEVFLDRSKMLFYFTAEKRVDFRELVRDLAAEFKMRIEMRQIGVRDEAKMVCGLGCCGRELCCASYLNRFDLVSVKMAKEQNLALNPTKISGICGRLMCCLAFEYQTYQELKRDLPKVGKHIVTKSGKGKIIRQNVLNQTVTVELEEGGEVTVHVSEIA
ncbi:MAG TPA: stage 0 sporulation family protein [Thermodesulfobacteriota bacterium]|nr:stage 0 sporulation family protein [Thermodesulfobacteriota bacterium]